MAQASLYEILDAAWVKEQFLLGVDLRTLDGSPFPDSLFQEGLKAAVASVEQDLDVTVEPIQTVNERYDVTVASFWARWALRIRKRPFIGLDAIKLYYGNQELAILPNIWGTILEYKQSDFQLLPQTDNQMQINPVVLPSLAIYSWAELPGWFSLSYRSGCRVYKGEIVIPAGETTASVTFDSNEHFLASSYSVVFELVDPAAADANIAPREYEKKVDGMQVALNRAPSENLTVRWFVTDIPDNLRRLIGIRAAKGPLAIAGDLVLGAGVQSRSIGLDGMSQSTATTKRGRGAYGDRLANLEAEEQALRNELQKVLGTFNIGAI